MVAWLSLFSAGVSAAANDRIRYNITMRIFFIIFPILYMIPVILPKAVDPPKILRRDNWISINVRASLIAAWPRL
jgi:hypothetical protein